MSTASNLVERASDDLARGHGERKADGLGHGSVLLVDALVHHGRDELHRLTTSIVIQEAIPHDNHVLIL